MGGSGREAGCGQFYKEWRHKKRQELRGNREKKMRVRVKGVQSKKR